MKKRFLKKLTRFSLFCLIMTAVLMSFSIFNVAASENESLITPQSLKFTPKGDGKFIYCNNTESMDRGTLAGEPNTSPRYVMNNEDLTPDRYYIYLSHINYAYDHDEYGNPSGLAFDVELDVEIYAKENSVLKIYNAACETPAVRKYIDQNGTEKFQLTNWGGMNACATMLKSDIYELNSSNIYTNRNYSTVTINIPKGETVWLSEYLDNYEACSMVMPIFIAADTELISGKVDMNVVQLRSKDGMVGDRSDFDRTNIGFGTFLRDRCHKGVADSLPEVNASLNYEIDDTIPDDTYLPVTFSNQFFSDVVTNEWVTNLNPQDDIWAKYTTVESDMLPLNYYDPDKLNYYGKNVPMSERDSVWHFDNYHSDAKGYIAESGVSPDDFSPNFELKARDENGNIIENNGVACSMGNYGVSTRYNLKIDNNGNTTRYFNYDASTTANIIVAVRDKNENLIETPICKREQGSITTDTCACVELKPHTTTEFILETILPVNYMGGLKNAFRITSTEQKFSFKTETKNWLPDYTTIENKYYDEYMQSANDETKELFSGNLNNFSVTETDYGYMLRWKEWDDHPEFQGQFKSLASDIYFLNHNFCLIGKTHFDKFPMDEKYCYGKFIITFQDGSRKFSTDGGEWYTPYWTADEDETMDSVMVKVNGEYLKFDQEPIIVNDRTMVPMRFIFEKFGLDVMWDDKTQTASVFLDDISGGLSFHIGNEYANINGKDFLLDTAPMLVGDRTLIPLRFLSEALGYIVSWNEIPQEVIINSIPKLPTSDREDYVIYREGYRDNRVELVFFNTEGTHTILWDTSITAINDLGETLPINDDVKYYLDEDTNTWVKFEENYNSISNYATMLISTGSPTIFR